MGWFSKCHIWAWNLVIGQISRSCTYTVLLPHGVKIEVIFPIWAVVSEILDVFKIAVFGHGIPEVAHILSFYPRVEIGPIFDQRAAVLGMRANFPTCYIWAWNLAIGQSSRSCIYTPFLPQGVVNELIFALRTALSEIPADFQNWHIWPWNLVIGQSSRSCTYDVFLPQGVKLEFIFALRAAVSDI